MCLAYAIKERCFSQGVDFEVFVESAIAAALLTPFKGCVVKKGQQALSPSGLWGIVFPPLGGGKPQVWLTMDCRSLLFQMISESHCVFLRWCVWLLMFS